MTILGPVVPAPGITDLLQQCDIYIFGFGSLIHSPGFDHVDDKRIVGFIRGYRRVFWQGSTDHRGVPGAPGRVVTLEPDPTGVVWGVAYRLAGSRGQQQRTLQYLEWREKQYDVRAHVEVFTAEQSCVAPVTALTYIASSDRQHNPNYLGPAPLPEIAAQIAASAGPSGPNCEYVFKLADAMRGMSIDDPELFLLESLVRAELAAGHAPASPTGEMA